MLVVVQVPAVVSMGGNGTGAVQAASAQVLTVTVPGPPRPLKVAAVMGPVSAIVRGLHMIGSEVTGPGFQRPSASGSTCGLTVTVIGPAGEVGFMPTSMRKHSVTGPQATCVMGTVTPLTV